MKIGVRPAAWATALLFLLGLLGLATIDEEAGSTRLTAAAEATTAQGTARMAMAISFGPAGGQQVALSGEGVVDMRANRARLTLSSVMLNGPMEVLVDGTTTYIRADRQPFLSFSAGKPWVAVEPSTSTTIVAMDTLGQTDPMQWLRLLEDAGIADDIREKGVEEVRGTPVTRYAAVLDVGALLEEIDSPQAQALGSAVRDSGGEVEVWLAEDGTVRRSVFRMSFGAFATTVTVELFDFGVAADGLEPPPPDQVSVQR